MPNQEKPTNEQSLSPHAPDRVLIDQLEVVRLDRDQNLNPDPLDRFLRENIGAFLIESSAEGKGGCGGCGVSCCR